MKKLLCKLFGHKLVLELRYGGRSGNTPAVERLRYLMDVPVPQPWRLRCIRCGVVDPWQ
jgi:hypothetical protein